MNKHHVTVGTRFHKRWAKPYNLGGIKGVHTRDLLCEVTVLHEASFEYRVIELVTEMGRPPFAEGNGPEKGVMAWFGLDASLERGDVVFI